MNQDNIIFIFQYFFDTKNILYSKIYNKYLITNFGLNIIL